MALVRNVAARGDLLLLPIWQTARQFREGVTGEGPVAGAPDDQGRGGDARQVRGQIAHRARDVVNAGGGALVIQRGLDAHRFRQEMDGPASRTQLQAGHIDNDAEQPVGRIFDEGGIEQLTAEDELQERR